MPLMATKGHEFKPGPGQLAQTINRYSGQCSIVILINYLRIKTSYDFVHSSFNDPMIQRTDALDHWIIGSLHHWIIGSLHHYIIASLDAGLFCT